MKLEQQIYQLEDRGKIEHISHKTLLGDAKQIIRLKTEFYSGVTDRLINNEEVSLFNHYNSINIDLIRRYNKNYDENKLAKIVEIVDRNEKGPILGGKTLKAVEVNKMKNLNLEEIEDEDLKKSLVQFKNEVTVEELLDWMSKKFYGGSITPEEIISQQKLFYRQIMNF